MNASKLSEHSLRPGESCVEKFSSWEHPRWLFDTGSMLSFLTACNI